LTASTSGQTKRVEEAFAEFNESWMVYWDAYVELQNQLYESVKAAREVSWLAATDTAKMAEINQAQRQLFASIPRRVDYAPLGQVAQNMDNALRRLNELQAALTAEKAGCKRMEAAIDLLLDKANRTKQELQGPS
jgi:hypothetical protein